MSKIKDRLQIEKEVTEESLDSYYFNELEQSLEIMKFEESNMRDIIKKYLYMFGEEKIIKIVKEVNNDISK